MPAAPYMRTAANQLRSAAANLQQEIRTIQTETDRAKWQLNNEISSAEAERANLKAELAGVGDNGRRAEIQSRMQQLEQDLSGKKQQVSQRHSEAALAVQAKVDVMNNIQDTASQLESVANSAT